MAGYLFGGVTEQANASVRRRADARVLFENQHWRGAMYMLGYAVECRLKASLMEKHEVQTLNQLEVVLTRKLKHEVSLREHNLEYLLELLELRTKLIGRDRNDKNLLAFHRCNRWTVSWRYRSDEGREEECRNFFAAVDQFLDFLAHNT